MFLTEAGMLHNVQNLSQRTDSKFYILCFSSRSSSEPIPTLSSDRASIDLTTDVDSVSICCTSHESTQEDTDLGNTVNHEIHVALKSCVFSKKRIPRKIMF